MITDVLSELEQKLEGIQIDAELKHQILSKVGQSKTEAERILADLKRTTDQSVTRKTKLGQLSNTILDLQSQNKQLDVLRLQNQKLSKYKQAAINQKKSQVAKIKNLFDFKLSNQTNKDYQKYKNLSAQFNFQDADNEQVINKNLQIFKVLEVAGIFDNDKQMLINPIPKSNPADNQKTHKGSNWLS